MNKRMQWTLFAVLSLFSPALLALGLGGAVVESYLDQPLDVRVELISQSEEELQSITAGLASAEDFQLLGMSRTAITVPLYFDVVSDAGKPYIHITSDLNVNEPVVQVLVEIVWASGRMLREYTLFLDPPTIESTAPPVVVKPAQAPAPEVETNAPVVAPIQKEAKPVENKVEASVATPVSPEPTAEMPAETTEAESTPDAIEDGVVQARELYSDDEVYGPVARGETLWGIARDYSKGSGYSINQTMLALQRKNPEAFIKGNINSLKRGAILRLPAFSEMGVLSSREALLEVVRQEEEIRTGIRSVAPEFDTPTIADTGDYQATTNEDVAEAVPEEEGGRLELVPPAEEEIPEALSSEEVPAQGGEVETLQKELSRTEEELVNARQENTYLSERIMELEAEAMAREQESLTVEDSSLANLESQLAEDRTSDQAEPPIAITPGGEKQPWYAGKTPLIGAGAVILIALIVWLMRRRSTNLVSDQRSSEVQAISDDAEEILRTLDSDESEGETVIQPGPETAPAQEPETEAVVEHEPEPEPEPEPEFKPEIEADVVPEEVPDSPYIDIDDGPTVVVSTPDVPAEPEDEPLTESTEGDESQAEDDPEIKLDLARAYLSLGDKEASRSMLDEVIKSGNDEQKAEARQMLEEL